MSGRASALIVGSGRSGPARAPAPAAPAPPRRGRRCGTRGSRRARADPRGRAPGLAAVAACGAGSRRSVNAGRRSGTRPRSATSWRPSPSARSSFVEAGSGASSTRLAIASLAGVSAWRRSAVKIGVRIARPTTTPACRAAIVQPPCSARGIRSRSAAAVSESTESPRPRPTSTCGAIVQASSAPGSSARPVEPAGDQHRPGDRLRPRPGAHAPEQRPGRQRRQPAPP